MEDVGLPVNGIMGTSAGALIGSMYAAGYSPREVGARLLLVCCSSVLPHMSLICLSRR